MDQIKSIGRLMGKHGFWVGCVLIVCVSIAAWYMSRGKLDEDFESQQSAITTKINAVKSLSSKQAHPNTHSNEQMDALNDNVMQLVLNAWQKQFSHQENILVWPRELRSDFIAAVRPLKPIEAKVDFPTPPSQELKIDYKARYANYVANLLPRLANEIGAKWQTGRRATTTSGMSRAEQARLAAEEAKIIVEWTSKDQARLLANHFNWSKQRDGRPTTLQILYAQEDLWVLTALMKIIRATNGDIESRHEAVVKTVESVMIGRGAIGRSGKVTRLKSESTVGGMDMSTGMESSAAMGNEFDNAYDATGSGAATGATAATPASRDPGNGRYVDNDYQPLTAERLRTAFQSENAEDAFLVVAKRMPVRLNLVVDQRKLHRLLAECGNSALPVEVRQVRVNRKGATTNPGSYGMDMGAGMDMGSGMDMGGGDMGGGDEYTEDYGLDMEMGDESDSGLLSGDPYGSGGGDSYGTGQSVTRTAISSESTYDMPVEIYGIIYIYNPVDRQKLGIEELESADTGEPTEPAPTSAG